MPPGTTRDPEKFRARELIWRPENGGNREDIINALRQKAQQPVQDGDTMRFMKALVMVYDDEGGLRVYVLVQGANTKALSWFHNNFSKDIIPDATKEWWTEPVHGAGLSGVGVSPGPGGTEAALRDFRDHWSNSPGYEEIVPGGQIVPMAPGADAQVNAPAVGQIVPMVPGMDAEENLTFETLSEFRSADVLVHMSYEEIYALIYPTPTYRGGAYRSLAGGGVPDARAALIARVRRKLRDHFGLAD